MRIHLPITAGVLLSLLISAASAVPPTTLPDNGSGQAEKLAGEFAARLKQVRYMEKGPGRPVSVPGWEGFPARRYTYQVKDKDGTVKSADVILLDPSADRIARWIVEALVEVNGTYTPDDGRKLFKEIIGQSGGQFPIAGVVYEDILPADGKNEIYCFRDGVTVQVQGVPHRGIDPMTPAQIEASINGRVTRIYTYARIASTSPQMWVAAGGSKEVIGKDGKPTEKWMETIRKAYKSAWNSDRNALIVAWVKANMKPVGEQ
jgi:hypothetical protein